MAWIESHQELGRHPKTLRLASGLKCSVPAAVGYLHFLWWWALDYAPDGKVPVEAKGVAAKACWWKGNPEVFWRELESAGFVEDLQIHDWFEYAGRLLERRAANVMRTQRARDAQRTRNERARYGATNRTVPDQPTGVRSSVTSSPDPVSPGRAREAEPPLDTRGLPAEVVERLSRPPIAAGVKSDGRTDERTN